MVKFSNMFVTIILLCVVGSFVICSMNRSERTTASRFMYLDKTKLCGTSIQNVYPVFHVIPHRLGVTAQA